MNSGGTSVLDMLNYSITDQDGLTVTVRDYRPTLRSMAKGVGIDGAVLVHGTYAVGYHTDALHRRCGGHEIARVRVTP